MEQNKLISSINDFILKNKQYYQQWVFEEQIIINNIHYKKLLKLHNIMHKLILHFVRHFDDYKHLMMLSKKTLEIIESLKTIDYNVGTFRTDFVYDKNNQPKLIEITCRFALNTLFISSIYDAISTEYHHKNYKDLEIINPYINLFPYIANLSKNGKIYVLRGKDIKNESVFFKEIFENAGRNVEILHYKKLKNNLKLINKNDWVISELTIEEIESLETTIIMTLSNLNLINDFRTALLIHDKQFFSVLNNNNFQKKCLNGDERKFLKDFLIPTYNFNQKKEYWKEAKHNKNDWILKHKALGKSKSIYAGIVTEQNEWNILFEKENLNEFVLQEWVPQNKIEGTINTKTYNDYITGTLLFFNEYFFGMGLYRTSSFPVTNMKDDRKATAIILKENTHFNIKHKHIKYITS